MSDIRRRPLAIRPQITLLIIMAILLLPWLGTTWFNSKGEPREALVAVSILNSGDWILPVSFGGDIPFKPPFMAWVIALFARIFNAGVVNEYISRLPSALAFMAMIWAGYRWSARLRDERFAMIMALVTLTAVEPFRDAISCRLDMVLTASMVVGMYLLFDLLDRRVRNRGLRYLAVVCLLSIATLTKGPVGALLPCLVMGVYYLMRGERFWTSLVKLSAICVASLVLYALWFWAAVRQGGDQFVSLMMEENLGRLTGTMSYDSHLNPWWYNFTSLLAGMAPWTLILVLCIPKIKQLRGLRLHSGGLFAVVLFVIVVGFYCIPASKRSVYLLPVYPAIAYGVSSLIIAVKRSVTLKTYVWVLAILSVCAPVLVVLAIYGVIHSGHLNIAELRWWMWPFLCLPVLAGFVWMLNRHASILFSILLPLILMLSYVSSLQPSILNSQSDRPLMTAICSGDRMDQRTVYTLGQPSDLRFYTLNFYLGDRMRMVSPQADSLQALPAGTPVLFDMEVADTSVFGGKFRIERLTDRGCDHRNPVGLAVKR